MQHETAMSSSSSASRTRDTIPGDQKTSSRAAAEDGGGTDSSIGTRPLKRLRTDSGSRGRSGSANTPRSSTGPDSDASADVDNVGLGAVDLNLQAGEKLESGLTASLPHIKPAAADTASAADAPRTADGRYTSSLYTDAFQLALDTVLAEESHLFSESEAETFQRFRSLPYEARYLYVRLFLRKTGAWFRTTKLSYHSNIADIPAACDLLCSPDIALAQHATASTIKFEEAANLLTLEELRPLAKDEQIPGFTKPNMIAAFKAKAATQKRLKFNQTGLLGFGFGDEALEERKFIHRFLNVAGPCIRLNPEPADLFHRVHLVFYRSTEYTESSLTTLILARTSQRNYPEYIVSRTANIFASRAVLVEFEEALKLQARVDVILEESGVPTLEDHQEVLDIAESVWPRWKELVEEERDKVKTVTTSAHGGNDAVVERIYLRRFSPAWVFTRILHKGLKFYHTGRRGAWYQRKALLEERYFISLPNPPGLTFKSDNERKRYWYKEALKTCCAGLEDPLTHITFHLDLQKRLKKLEQGFLRIPKREQHDFSHLILNHTTTTRTITGIRLSAPVLGRKIVWRHPYPTDDSKPTCTVEEMCLAHYKHSHGWEGFHSESTILLTLFAHLFYDILFLYVPNVFETEYQTCPLDLFTEAFYPTRASEINHRLVEIENGKAKEIVEGVWDREGERKPFVVGLDWNLDKTTLGDIVQCIPDQGLAMICKVLCQEYQPRSRGIPDLFLWSLERKECMFVEVKSENDRLSDAQRLWIHLLSTAGIKTELCLAVAQKEDETAELDQVKKEKEKKKEELEVKKEAEAANLENGKHEEVDENGGEIGQIAV